MLRSVLVIGIVAAVVVAAVIHGVVGGEEEAPDRSAGRAPIEGSVLEGPDVPPEGALAGSLLFAAEGCRVHRLDLALLALVATPLATDCAFWPSPTGSDAVLAAPGAGPAGPREIWLTRLGDDAGEPRRLGTARGEVVWSPAGDRLAWCTEDGTSVVADAGGAELARVPGCGPRFTPAGSLLTAVEGREGRGLLADGSMLLDEADLRRALPPAAGPVAALGYDQRDDGLLAVVVAAGTRAGGDLQARPGPFGRLTFSSSALPRLVIELWRDGRLERSASLRGLAYPFGNLGFGEVVRFSPGGRELAVGSSGLGVPLMLLDAGTLDPVLRPVVQDGFAWSPDGAWFALAGPRGIRIAGRERSTAAYVLPIGAATLAWQ